MNSDVITKVSTGLSNSVTEYLKRGFSLIPTDEFKASLIKWTRFQSERADEPLIRSWQTKFPGSNIAIVTGRTSDLSVIDCDSTDACSLLESLLPPGTRVPKVYTPNGGCHYYFRNEDRLHTSTNARLKIDVRAEGGYVVAPPSRTETGRYHWDERDNLFTIETLPIIPENVVDYIQKSSSVQSFKEGERDNGIFHVALEMAKQGCPENEAITEAIRIAGQCEPPFPESEAIKKVASAYKRVNNFQPINIGIADLGTYSGNELVNSEMVPPVYIIEPIFAEQDLVICSGPPKLGKSILSTNLAISIAAGLDWLDFKVSKPRKVLIIQQEMKKALMRKRFDAMLQAAPLLTMSTREKADVLENILMNDVRGVLLDTQEGLKKIQKEIEKHRPEVLILDPLADFHTKSENRAEEMSRVFSILHKLIDDYKIAIIVIHHHGKPTQNERQGGEQHRGSSVIGATSDGNWTMNRLPSARLELIDVRGAYAKIGFELRGAESIPDFYILRDNQTLWYRRVEISEKRAVTVDDIYQAVAENEGIFQKDLVNKFCGKATKRHIKEAILRSERDERIYAVVQKAKSGKPKRLYTHKPN